MFDRNGKPIKIMQCDMEPMTLREMFEFIASYIFGSDWREKNPSEFNLLLFTFLNFGATNTAVKMMISDDPEETYESMRKESVDIANELGAFSSEN